MQEEIFGKYPIPKAYFKLALPVVFSMVISLIYNMVDTYFIAGTGNTDLVAGVALGTPIFTLMIALGDIFGLGGSSFISRLFGEKKFEDAKSNLGVCFSVLYLYRTGRSVYHCGVDAVQSAAYRGFCHSIYDRFCAWCGCE